MSILKRLFIYTTRTKIKLPFFASIMYCHYVLLYIYAIITAINNPIATPVKNKEILSFFMFSPLNLPKE
jgi:hypothetical protein